MNNYCKEMYKAGYTLKEYQEQLEYIKNVANNIVNVHLKKGSFGGAYRDISILESLYPELNKVDKKQLMVELKNIGVETYDNGSLWRY